MTEKRVGYGQMPCPKCKGHGTQENRSIHGYSIGTGTCCVCGGKGKVSIDYDLYKRGKRGA